MEQVKPEAKTSVRERTSHPAATESVQNPTALKALDDNTIIPLSMKQKKPEANTPLSQSTSHATAKEPVRDPTYLKTPDDNTIRPPSIEATQHLASHLSINDKESTSQDTSTPALEPPTKRDLTSWWKEFKTSPNVTKGQEKISDKGNTSHAAPAPTLGAPMKRDLASWWKEFKRNSPKGQEKGMSREIPMYSEPTTIWRSFSDPSQP
jgi:hypothetical protein